MRDRIKQIIEREGMSQSQFADYIGVNRPTLSHVIAGRNNPSIEIMMKIHQRFPKINILWLLDGIGDYETKTWADYSPNSLVEGQHTDENLLSSSQSPLDAEEDSGPSIPFSSPGNDTPSRFYQGDLFAENSIFTTENTGAAKKRKEMPLQPPPKAPYMSDTQTDYARKFLQRKIVEIKIFYDDGTYETFRQ
jgi:transcriptional regulator with XRE-family HTH domain